MAIFEVVSPVDERNEIGFLFETMSEAVNAAGPEDEVWQLASDEDLTRVLCVLPKGGVKPGMRCVNGEWLYSARWL